MANIMGYLSVIVSFHCQFDTNLGLPRKRYSTEELTSIRLAWAHVCETFS